MHSIVSLFTTYLPYFVLVLTLLVFVHEFGHYWVGRRFGIHAEVFSIGFGPELFGWTDRNGTRWKISADPARRLREVPGRQRRRQRHAVGRAAVGRPAKTRLLHPAALCARRGRAGRPGGQPAVRLPAADRRVLRRGRALLAGDRRGAGRRPGGQGRPAHGRRDRAPGRQARSIATRTSRTSQFLYWAKPMAVEYRRGDQLLQHRDRAAILRAHRQVQQHACASANSAWTSSSARWSAASSPNSPAEAAGLKVGDLLLDIDGKPVDHFTHIPELIGDRAGQPVTRQVRSRRPALRDHRRAGGRQGHGLHRQGPRRSAGCASVPPA